MSSDLDQDPRWRRLYEREWVCPCCQSKQAGLLDLGCSKPDHWQGDERQPNSELRRVDNILTEDFCILDGEHFLVRCVLQLPIIGSTDQFFGFGAWSTLSKDNFDLYADTFNDDRQGELGPWFGWFSNRLKGYPDTLHLASYVHPRNGRQRPHIELEPTEHPLAVQQRHGITFDQVLDLYALNGHDLRQALYD